MTFWLFYDFIDSADFPDFPDSADFDHFADFADFLILVILSYLVSSKRLLFENIAHVGPFSVFVFAFFCKSFFSEKISLIVIFSGGVSLTINQQSGKLDTQVCFKSISS